MKPETKARLDEEQRAAIAAAVKAVVDKAPPLTPHQRDVIAVTFQGANVHAVQPAGADVLSEMLED